MSKDAEVTQQAESLLALDLGSMTTRATLFDVVDGSYQFIAAGTAGTSVDAPLSNALAGVIQAVQTLQELCGRKLLDDGRALIQPTHADGSGVDHLVLTHSAGPRVKVALGGLLDGFSLESADRLVRSLPAEVVEKLSLGDLRSHADRLDDLLAAKPELMILSGGTEGGANRSVYELVELAGLVSQVLRDSSKPVVMYCGNQSLVEKVEELLGRLTRLRVAPNLRPSIDEENYDAVLDVYSRIITEIRLDQFYGLREIAQRCSANPLPAAYAFGRMIRFLSQVYDPARGVMGIDLGASALTTAAARSGRLELVSFPYGMGDGLEQLVRESKLEDFARWLPFDMADDELRDHLSQTSLYPYRLPSTEEGLAISQAVARQALRLAVQKLRRNKPGGWLNYEPFMISGSVLTQNPQPAGLLSVLLDGIQPTGVTTFILDQNNILPGLGAAATVNPLLPVQLLESGAFRNLATVICPVSRARDGAAILDIRLEYEDGSTVKMDVKKGSLLKLPVLNGQEVKIHLEASRQTYIDPASEARAGSYAVTGGSCGVVIDARSRPLQIPADKKKRQALLQKWNRELGL
jgi:hypothetical protein